MKPTNLKTKIFLDSGDPNEIKEIIKLLGFLDGQTTNPTLISKHPNAKLRLEKGEKFTKNEIFSFYKEVVKEMSNLIPNDYVSIEVYSDKNTTSYEMIKQGVEMFSWIPNAHIKFPITNEGLIAAQYAVKEVMRVNMTLCFSQEQAAAVYAATLGAKKGDVHVEVLAASVRSLSHLLYAIELKSDIITAPFIVLKEWAEKGMPMRGENFNYDTINLKPIPYQEINLNKPWQEYNIKHGLTDIGIEKFSSDWNQLLLNKWLI